MFHVIQPFVRVVPHLSPPYTETRRISLRAAPGGAPSRTSAHSSRSSSGIVHAALAPVIVIGGVKPNLVLVGVVLVTALYGFMPGITWAFVAGVTANLLVGDPLGSVPLALLVVAALVSGGARVLGRMPWVYPILAAGLGSVVADVIALVVRQLVSDVAIGPLPIDLMLGAAALNAAVAGLVLLPARAVAGRYAPDEAAAW